MLIGTDETDRHRMVCILLTDSGLGYTSLLFTVQSDWAAVIFMHQGFNITVSQFYLHLVLVCNAKGRIGSGLWWRGILPYWSRLHKRDPAATVEIGDTERDSDW